MPTLDRRITVRRTVYVPNAFGKPVETITNFPIWAGVADLSAFDVEQEGGVFDERLRRWDIRYRADFAAFTISELSVIDSDETFNVQNLVRQPDRGERRRFMKIEGVAVT